MDYHYYYYIFYNDESHLSVYPHVTDLIPLSHFLPFHFTGTHCTGSMVGIDDTKSPRHVYGVAPKASYIGCMGLDRGSGTLDALLSCWQFTVAPTTINGKN